ncbi:cutinase family protein [Aeromicrobium sp. NPDC092404]|uniref:cutinase family protein n=1 Tax=Aeromicrobium sp. NPDC092404 TaxID=3154976 RepID=UPI00342ED527
MSRGAVLGGALAVVLALTACSGPVDPRPSRGTPPVLVSTGCADLVVLGLRGAGQDAGRNQGSGREILASVRAMSAELHRSSPATVRLEGVPYRAEVAPTSDFHRGNIEDGMGRTRARLDELAERCPESRVAIIGFSQGAHVVHELVSDLEPEKQVALVAMIADPIRNPADPITAWSYGDAAPGPGAFGAGPELGARWRDRAITFCAARDEICNWPEGGYEGPLSETHRHFYETPAHARSTGRQLAKILRANGV